MSSASDPAATLHNFKRRRTRERANGTRFSTVINALTEDSSIDDFEHFRGRLQDTLDKLTVLDDAIHDLLSDGEYEADVENFEEYVDKIKRAIQKATLRIDSKLAASTSLLSVSQPPQIHTYPAVTHSVKLPPIMVEPFAGDIETWSRFWEQFESSIDKDPSLSTINKHVFLRGYLEGEPKMLVDGIAITASTYEETKRILHTRYGDRNRIIQAHLDYPEEM